MIWKGHNDERKQEEESGTENEGRQSWMKTTVQKASKNDVQGQRRGGQEHMSHNIQDRKNQTQENFEKEQDSKK